MERKKGVILSYILMIFEVFSTLILTPFIISSLGRAEYGVYKLIISVTGYIMLLDLGVGNSVVKYVAKYIENDDRESNRKFLGVTTLFYGSIAAIAIVVGLFLIYIFPSTFSHGLTAEEIDVSIKLLYITILNAAVMLGTAGFSNTVIGFSKFSVSKGMAILKICIKIPLTFIALKLGFKSIAIVTIQLITTILFRGFFVVYVLFVLKLKPLFKNLNWNFIKEVVVYSGFIMLQMIATQINAGADQIILGIMVPGAVTIIGIYGVGMQVVQYFQSIGSVFNGVLMPGVVKLVENGATGKQLQNEMTRIGRISFIVLGLLWAGFIVVGKPFVVLWAGAEYVGAYYVICILMTAHLIIYPQCIGIQVLWAKNENKELSFMKLSIVLLNVVVTVFLVKFEPLIGATVGTFISLITGDVIVMNYLFKKKIKVQLLKYYRDMARGIAPSICVAVIAGILLNVFKFGVLSGLIIKGSVVLFVYVFCMISFGFNEYEKELIYGILKKVKFLKRRNKNVQK